MSRNEWSGSNEPLLWRLIEALVVNVMVAVAIVVAIVVCIWDALKGLVHNK